MANSMHGIRGHNHLAKTPVKPAAKKVTKKTAKKKAAKK